MMKWSNEMIMEFLRWYEKEPVIWDPRNVSHKDRFAIADAWRRIEANMSVPCVVEELKRKKDSLMATFRSLTIKVKTSLECGQGTEDVYRPNWFAYDTMSKFLGEIYQPRTYTGCREDSEDPFKAYDNEQTEYDTGSPVTEDAVENDDDSKHSFTETTFKPPPDRRNRKRREMVMRPEQATVPVNIKIKTSAHYTLNCCAKNSDPSMIIHEKS
ncbi:hypothetical protein JTB14_014943 [Gonioctena quinquepunctata]|nr:hypothetical protein JTB14_014943 [Gonioctena quinquepunctata]